MIYITSERPKINIQTLNRLSYYHSFLTDLYETGETHTTATAIAEALGIKEVVVRKDVSLIRTEKGRPNTAFEIQGILSRLEECLGFNNTAEAVMVANAGFARSLISGLNIETTGMKIVAIFDPESQSPSGEVDGVSILPLEKLSDLCTRLHIKVGVICTSDCSAQAICDLMVSSGIKFILNYSHSLISAPQGVYLQNENLSAHLISFLHYVHNTTENM